MATLSTIAQPVPAASLRRLMIRHPVAAYLILAFTFTWGSLIPLLLSKQGFGILPIDLPLDFFNSLACMIGLPLPAFLVTAAIDGKAGVQELLRRCFRWRVGIQWYAIALFGMFVAVIIAALPFVGGAPLHMIVQKWQILFTVFLPGALIPFLHTNLPEEIGWTGFVQSRLQERYGSVKASLLVALPFALIHLPSYFVAGWISDERLSLPEALVMVGVTAVFATFFRLLIMWLYNGTGSSILIVALFHSAFNMLTGQLITPEFIPGVDASSLNLLVWAVTAVLAVLIAVATRGRLARPIKED